MTRFKKYLLLLTAVLIFISARVLFSDKPQTSLPHPSQTPLVVSSTDLVRVVRVIDGDTIEIEGEKKVRYIGVDTPETVAPGKPLACFGKEASDKNKELVEGKLVKLEKDVSETDKYGRLLRYVYIPQPSGQDIFVNDKLVRDGYARISTFPPDVKYQNLFLESERYARENNLGLWSNCPTN